MKKFTKSFRMSQLSSNAIKFNNEYKALKKNYIKLFSNKKKFVEGLKKDILTNTSSLKELAILLKKVAICEMNIIKYLLDNNIKKTKFYFDKFKELSSEFLEEYSQHDLVKQGTYLSYCDKLKKGYDFYIESLENQKEMKERKLGFSKVTPLEMSQMV